MIKQYHFFMDYEIKDINSRNRTLTVTASDETVDYVNDILIAEGCQYPDNGRVPGLWAHNRKRELPPIFKTTWITNTDQRVRTGIEFARTPFAKEIFELYEQDFLTDFSVGFKNLHERNPNSIERHKGAGRVIDLWRFLELSSVPIGANPNAKKEKAREKLLRLKNAVTSGRVRIPKIAYKDFGFNTPQEYVTFADPKLPFTDKDIERIADNVIKKWLAKTLAKEIMKGTVQELKKKARDKRKIRVVRSKKNEIITFKD